MKIQHRADYRARRRDAYPDIGDQLDAIAKAFTALQQGQPLPPDTVEWIDSLQAVKERHKKD